MSNRATDLSVSLNPGAAGRARSRIDGLQGHQIRQIAVATTVFSWCGILMLFGVI